MTTVLRLRLPVWQPEEHYAVLTVVPYNTATLRTYIDWPNSTGIYSSKPVQSISYVISGTARIQDLRNDILTLCDINHADVRLVAQLLNKCINAVLIEGKTADVALYALILDRRLSHCLVSE